MKPLEDKTYQLTEKDALSIYARMLHTLDSSEFESFFSAVRATNKPKVTLFWDSKPL